MIKQNNIQLRFVVCIRNEGSDDLSLRKIYQILPDEAAAEENFIRVIDDSGEDYLYPANYFIQIELSEEIEQALLIAA
ncbi:MAG: hypothetical protein KDJ65_33750 [Anaerolineae bacterium]|nr:hypothetical protein [Anaerolineae bacterium]